MTFGGTHGGVEEAQKALNVNKKIEKHTGKFMAVCYHNGVLRCFCVS